MKSSALRAAARGITLRKCVLHVFGSHVGSVTAVLFTPDGGRALSGSHDQTLRRFQD